jgi:Xaa-Pro aminopeptidase
MTNGAPAPVPADELALRMRRFRVRMDATQPGWELAVFLGRVNQFYFTGTMQDGMVLVPRDGEAVFWVRRSYERAIEESVFPDIRAMRGFRDAAQGMGPAATRASVHLETELVPLALAERFRKHFPSAAVRSVDGPVAATRAVKSPFELAILERAGARHRQLLEVEAPTLLSAGISEAEFGAALYSLMLRSGHQGTVRFNMFNVDVVVGQLGFGENSLYPTNFDGPGGCRGLEPAAPVMGSRERTLAPGDLVFTDIGFGFQGYATDKTAVYMFGRPLPDTALAAHARCVQIERSLASQLKPGAIPSQLYATAIADLEPEFLENFMGFGNRRAHFLGHGVGLNIDEPPVIAGGFDEPLAEGMVLALEPKKGVPGVGMVGTENTYVVTPEGGRSLTGEMVAPILVALPGSMAQAYA